MPLKLTLRSRDILRKLSHLGFMQDRMTGSHVILYEPQTGRRAVVPRHNSELPKGTVKSIIREARIELDDFWNA